MNNISPTLNSLLSLKSTALRSGKQYATYILLAYQVKSGKRVMLCGCSDPKRVIKAMQEIGVNAEYEADKNGATFKLKR